MEIRRNVVVEVDLFGFNGESDPPLDQKRAIGVVGNPVQEDVFWIDVIYPDSLAGVRTTKEKSCLSPLFQLSPGEWANGESIARYLKEASMAL